LGGLIQWSLNKKKTPTLTNQAGAVFMLMGLELSLC
jgi:hypothetical protein